MYKPIVLYKLSQLKGNPTFRGHEILTHSSSMLVPTDWAELRLLLVHPADGLDRRGYKLNDYRCKGIHQTAKRHAYMRHQSQEKTHIPEEVGSESTFGEWPGGRWNVQGGRGLIAIILGSGKTISDR
jgi:hypothetical protein